LTQKLEHRPTLDGLRGFACILVVISHLLPSNTIGALGVIMFFSLSGFLMGMLYLDKPCIKTNIVKYSISRISRIAPAYYVAITLYVVVFTLLPDGNELTAVGIARTYLFMGSISVFWSIPPEIQFYVFFYWIMVRIPVIYSKIIYTNYTGWHNFNYIFVNP
jgi:peptidoglycan/LPS O-acetylase OafA/YrhL